MKIRRFASAALAAVCILALAGCSSGTTETTAAATTAAETEAATTEAATEAET